LKPEQEKILNQAIEAGLITSPEDALDEGLRSIEVKLGYAPKEQSTEEWIARFHAWVDSHGWQTVVLPDEAMSRDSIYADCGLVDGKL